MITSAQWRAARALLDWSQADLCKHLGTAAAKYVSRLETGNAAVPDEVCKCARETYEARGVEFIDESRGAGVKFKSPAYARRPAEFSLHVNPEDRFDPPIVKHGALVRLLHDVKWTFRPGPN